MTNVASMPMYYIPEVRSVMDEFWRGLANYFKLEGCEDFPETLSHDRPLSELWNRPSLEWSD